MIDDGLRPPPPTDPDVGAYKDWLHLNVFDHPSGAVMLFNTSLHGAPADPRARAIGAALVHHPERGWIGNVAVRGFDEAVIAPNSIALEHLALAVDPAHERVLVSAAYPDDTLEASIATRAAAQAVDIEDRLPFGSGWISWYAVPRLAVSGNASVGGHRFDLSHASAYHDHNWGRWHWGDDVGWEWGAFLAASPGPSLVVTRTTGSDHRQRGAATLLFQHGAIRRRFVDKSVTLRLEGRFEGALRRIPGALAALHQDRATPLLPARVVLHAADGFDSIDLEFHPRAAAQLIAADPERRGYGFVHELVGEFSAVATIAGSRQPASGLGVFEYVD
jgi:hypothetical protein